MPWGRRIDHHRPIEYVETELRPQAQFAVERRPDAIVVTGNCPACGGLMTTEFPWGIGGTGSKGPRDPRRPAAGVPARGTMICECGHVHPGKPATATDDGCGRFWLVDLTAAP